MPKKPTTPFGYIAFGKNGSVKTHVQQLPETKQGQERGVAEAFVILGADLIGAECSVQSLEENDHDFMLMNEDNPVAKVQCTEIVIRDFLAPPGTQSCELWSILGEPGEISGFQPVDVTKRDGALRTKIERKINKNYAEPVGIPLWLLVWTVVAPSHWYGSFHDAGKLQEPCALKIAREFLASCRAHPFSRMFFFDLQTNPTEIWSRPKR